MPMPTMHLLKNGEEFCLIGADEHEHFSAYISAHSWFEFESKMSVYGRIMETPEGKNPFSKLNAHYLARGDCMEFIFEDGEIPSRLGSSKANRGAQNTINKAAGKKNHRGGTDEFDEDEVGIFEPVELRWQISINNKQIPLIVDREKSFFLFRLHWDMKNPGFLDVSLTGSTMKEDTPHSSGSVYILESLPLGSCIELCVG